MRPGETAPPGGVSPKAAAAVFFCALALRLPLAFLPGAPHINPDSHEYLSIASNLRASGAFSLDGRNPNMSRTPGYPAFLAAASLAPGLDTVRAAAAAQAVTDSFSAVLCALLAASFCSAPYALLAGLAYAAHPVLIAYSGLVLSETLFLFFWMVFLLAAREAFRSGSLTAFASAGIILGFGVLVRPAHMFYWTALLPVALLSGRPARALAGLAALFLFLQLTVAPLKARNKAIFGVSAISTGAGSAVWIGSLLKYPVTEDALKVWPRGDFKSPEADEAFARAGRENWRKDFPALTAALPKRLARFWLTSHSSLFGIDKTNRDYLGGGALAPLALKAGLLALQAALLAAGLAGAWLMRRRPADALFLLMPAAYVSAHILNDWGPARYHLSALPCLMVLAASGLELFRGLRKTGAPLR